MERVAGLEALMGLRWVMEVGPSESTPELPGESGQPALLSTQLPTPPLTGEMFLLVTKRRIFFPIFNILS